MIQNNQETSKSKSNVSNNPENNSKQKQKELQQNQQLRKGKKNTNNEQTIMNGLEDSQTYVSQIDDKIMSGLKKSEQKRYTLLLQSMGFQPDICLKLQTSDQEIYKKQESGQSIDVVDLKIQNQDNIVSINVQKMQENQPINELINKVQQSYFMNQIQVQENIQNQNQQINQSPENININNIQQNIYTNSPITFGKNILEPQIIQPENKQLLNNQIVQNQDQFQLNNQLPNELKNCQQIQFKETNEIQFVYQKGEQQNIQPYQSSFSQKQQAQNNNYEAPINQFPDPQQLVFNEHPQHQNMEINQFNQNQIHQIVQYNSNKLQVEEQYHPEVKFHVNPELNTLSLRIQQNQVRPQDYQFKIIPGQQIQFRDREQQQKMSNINNRENQQIVNEERINHVFNIFNHQSQPLQAHNQFPINQKSSQSKSALESQKIMSQNSMKNSIKNSAKNSPKDSFPKFYNSDGQIILDSKNKNRKSSESSSIHSKSAQIKNQLSKLSASIKAEKISQNKRKSQQLINNKINDSRKRLQLNDFQNQILQVQEVAQTSNTYKFGTHQNSFSNRSQKSSDSNQSQKSSYRYNRFVDTVQVPQLSILQIVRQNQGRQVRVQRRSTNGSRNSRSASTCKKSYDDLSEINMEKIEQSDCEEDRSIKRLKHNFVLKNQFLSQRNKQSLKIQDIQPNVNKSYNHQSGLQIHYENLPQQKQNSKYEYQFSHDQVFSLSQRVKQQASLQVQVQDFKITQQFNEAIYIKQFIPKIDQSTQFQFNESPKKSQTHSSVKINNSVKKLNVQSQIFTNKQKKLDLSSYVFAVLQQPKSIQEQFWIILQECRQFFQQTHMKSNYEREKFYMMITKNFKILGLDLIVLNQIGLRLLHDGIFACAYISFLKDSKLNPGMIEWMMFTNFDQQIKIYTNKQIFNHQLQRVREERQMYYENQFSHRIEQIKQKLKSQIESSNKSYNIQSQVKSQNYNSRQIYHSSSLISLADSNGTVTLDGQDETLLIKKSQILEKKEIEKIPEVNQNYQKSFGDHKDEVYQSTLQNNKEKKKKTTRKDKKDKQSNKQPIKLTQTCSLVDEKRPKRRSSQLSTYVEQPSVFVDSNLSKDKQINYDQTFLLSQDPQYKYRYSRSSKNKQISKSKSKQKSKNKSKTKKVQKGILKPSKVAIMDNDKQKLRNKNIKKQDIKQQQSPSEQSTTSRNKLLLAELSPLKNDNPTNSRITRGRIMQTKQEYEKVSKDEKAVRFSVQQKSSVKKNDKSQIKSPKRSQKKSQSKNKKLKKV